MPRERETSPKKRLPWLSRFEGLGQFGVVWSGQVATLLGNSVLRFAFVVQAWTAGGHATQVVLLSLCAMLPQLLLSPTAGALVDRFSKRTALQLSDLGGVVVVGGLTAVYLTGHVDLWMIYVVVALLGACAAFEFPSLSSAVPLLAPKAQLQRANGLLGTARSGAEVCGPALAAVLIAVAGLATILWLDLATFVVALISVRLVRLPRTRVDEGPIEKAERKRLAADSLEGLRYLLARPSLRGLTLIFFTVNLVMVFGFAIVQPMVLARTGNDTAALASVMSSVGIGGIAGGLLLAAWGGPKNRVRGMMFGVIGMCLTAQIGMSMGRGVVAWCAMILLGALLMPIVNGTLQALIQTKVPPDRHGRVFGAVMFVSQVSVPVAMLLAGPLADTVFEPAAAARSGLVGALQPILGAGRGTGMATMLLIAGVLGALAAVVGLVARSVRDLEVLVPDVDSAKPMGG